MLKKFLVKKKKVWKMGHQQGEKKDKTERKTGVGRRTKEELEKWNQIIALRFHTGGRHQIYQASLRGRREVKEEAFKLFLFFSLFLFLNTSRVYFRLSKHILRNGHPFLSKLILSESKKIKKRTQS